MIDWASALAEIEWTDVEWNIVEPTHPNTMEAGDAVVETLTSVIPADRTSFNFVDAETLEYATIGTRVTPSDPEEVEGYMGNDLVAQLGELPLFKYFFGGESGPVRWEDLPDGQAFVESDLYQAMYGELGIRHQLAMRCADTSHGASFVSLSRISKRFTDREVELMEAMRPAINAVLHHSDTKARYDLAVSALSEGHQSVMIIAADGSVVESSGPAEAIPSWLGDLIKRKEGEARFMNGMVEGRSVRVVSGTHEHLVILGDRSNAADALTEAGLTARQVDVALALAAGGTNTEVSSRLGVGEGTLKTHLAAIYRRINVDNRGAAIAAINEIVGSRVAS
ncbi:MAG: hypothetical protein GEU79_01770 [Acidimicrobiia bacterium]|nr:hypothetical protein [Acidimicrobiia bacterium]